MAGGDDVICGNGGADDLMGDEGDDELRGGDSRIVGGDGEVVYYRDRLVGGPDDDVLVPGHDGGDHGSRWDLLDFSDAPGGIAADVAADTISGHGLDVVVGDDDAILGSRYDDSLIGGDGDDEVYGWDGADVLRGAQGDDTLKDSGDAFEADDAADDVVDGGRGDDHLDAEGGNDRVLGRGGDDLIGSWGSDADHIHAGPGRDTVYDGLVLSADQAVDAGPGRDEVMVGSDYEVDGRRVRPRTVIDLAAGTASIPAHDVTFRFAAGRADRIDGGPGHDIANGYGGADDCLFVEVRHSC